MKKKLSLRNGALALQDAAVRHDLGGVGPDEQLVASEPDRHEEHGEDGQRRHHVLDHAAERHAPAGPADEEDQDEEEARRARC